MLVEDESEVRSVVYDMLKHAGFDVFEVKNGSEALTYLSNKGHGIDVVLSDVVMPKLTGLQLADRLCEEHPRLPVVLMSGHTKNAQLDADIERGQKRFLQKPFGLEGLKKALYDALAV